MATEMKRELAGSAGGAEPQHCAGLHDMLASALCVMQGRTLGLRLARSRRGLAFPLLCQMFASTGRLVLVVKREARSNPAYSDHLVCSLSSLQHVQTPRDEIQQCPALRRYAYTCCGLAREADSLGSICAP